NRRRRRAHRGAGVDVHGHQRQHRRAQIYSGDRSIKKVPSRVDPPLVSSRLADHPELAHGKFLGVVSAADEGFTEGGIPFGAASGLIFRCSPAWIRNLYATPGEVSRIEDFAAKSYVIMRLALAQEISFFGTPNPSTILKLVESADQNKEEMIRDIRDGA